MSSLPPYSTFRTDNKQLLYPQAVSHGNVLSFTPPGFKQKLNVKFPDCRLAVCEKCKKNYKTRDMCRVRNNHSEEPWSTAYICITLDESCTDVNGAYVDKPFTVRMVQWQPYCVKEPFDSKTPVCAACKKTNRTRSFCRERHQHRQLPWCTVYVILSVLEKTDPNTVVAASSIPVGLSESHEEKIAPSDLDIKPQCVKIEPEKEDEEKENFELKDSNEGNIPEDKSPAPNILPKIEGEDTTGDPVIPTPDPTSVLNDKKVDVPTPSPKSKSATGDDINQIDPSRTFLAKVSCKGISVHWLELAEYDGTTATLPGVSVESNVQVLNAAIRNPSLNGMTAMDPTQYYANMGAVGYAHHHPQQVAVKMHQQHFLQLQQRQQQHFWQTHYNQQMQLGSQQGQMAHAVLPVSSPVLSSVNATANGQHQSQQLVQDKPQSAQKKPQPAQQSHQKQQQHNGSGNTSPSSPVAVPGLSPASSRVQEHSTGTVVTMAAQQQAQWQAHMLYQQQLYQQQLQMQQQGRSGPMLMQHHGVMMQPSMVQQAGVLTQPGQINQSAMSQGQLQAQYQQGQHQQLAQQNASHVLLNQGQQVSPESMHQNIGNESEGSGSEPSTKRQCV